MSENALEMAKRLKKEKLSKDKQEEERNKANAEYVEREKNKYMAMIREVLEPFIDKKKGMALEITWFAMKDIFKLVNKSKVEQIRLELFWNRGSWKPSDEADDVEYSGWAVCIDSRENCHEPEKERLIEKIAQIMAKRI